MRFSRPKAGAVAALAVATLLFSACSTTPEAPAEDEKGTLILYSGRGEDLVGPLIEQFEEESGITVKVRYSGTTEIAAQLLEEGDRTPAQVFLSQDAGALGALSAAGLLVELPEDVTSVVDPQYTSTDGSWVGLTGRARVVVYDGEQLTADGVPTLDELTQPEWHGRFGIAPTNASFQSFVTALRVIEGEEAAEAWLQGIIANEPQIFSGNGGILEAVNTGALEVGLINHYYWFQMANEVGAENLRAQLKYGEPGTASALVNVTGAAILSGSEESPEALEFIRYLLGPAGQEYFVTETAEYSLVPNGGSPEGAPALDELQGPDIDLSDLASLEETVALLQKVGLI